MIQQIISSRLEHVCSLWDWPIYNSYDVPQAWKEHGISFLHALKAFRVVFCFFLTVCVCFFVVGCGFFFNLLFSYISHHRLTPIFSFVLSRDRAFQDLSGDKITASTGITFLVFLATQLQSFCPLPTPYFLCMFTFRASSANTMAWQMQTPAFFCSSSPEGKLPPDRASQPQSGLQPTHLLVLKNVYI